MVVVLSWLSRTSPGKIVFVSFHTNGKFYGNVRALYEYAYADDRRRQDVAAKFVFITPHKATADFLRNAGLPVERRRFNWLLPLLGAEFVVVDAVPRVLALGKWSFVQLWHGSGFKNIELLDELTQSNRLQRFLSNVFYAKTRLIIATSKDDKIRKEKSFASTNVTITGSPRNDRLFPSKGEKNDWMKASPATVLYAPTFRSQMTDLPFSPAEWSELDNVLEKHDLRLLVKLHPAEKHVQVPSNLKRISDVTTSTEDVQSLLVKTNVLITDYSGIASDFVLTGRPMIFYTYDFDAYLKTNRTFYYNLPELLPGPFARTFSELLLFISDFGWFEEEQYQSRYLRFRRRMHYYLDNQSAERTFRAIVKLAEKR